MKMEKMPEVKKTEEGAFWKNTYEKFEARIYVPKSLLQGDILNYGFNAPYLLVFAEKPMDESEQVAFAREHGGEHLAQIHVIFGQKYAFVLHNRRFSNERAKIKKIME